MFTLSNERFLLNLSMRCNGIDARAGNYANDVRHRVSAASCACLLTVAREGRVTKRDAFIVNVCVVRRMNALTCAVRLATQYEIRVLERTNANARRSNVVANARRAISNSDIFTRRAINSGLRTRNYGLTRLVTRRDL